MIILGNILLWIGLISIVFGEIKFLVVAYQHGLLWFFGCLFIPIVYLIFFFLNIKATIKPIALQAVGLLLACAGAYLAGIYWHH